MDIKDGIINKLGLRIGQLEYEKANLQTQLEIKNLEIDELKNKLSQYEGKE